MDLFPREENDLSCKSWQLPAALWTLAVAALPGLGTQCLSAQDKLAEVPQITAVGAFTIVPGEKTKLSIRGLRLQEVESIDLSRDGTTILEVKLSNKPGSVMPPRNFEAATVGDMQLETDLALPEGTPAGPVSLRLKTAASASNGISLDVLEAGTFVVEKEPNDGFASAQLIELPSICCGRIHQPRDVDVYRFSGRRGDSVQIEANAARRNSLLDPIVTLYDGRGRVLQVSDDAEGLDSRLEFALPADGDYLVSIVDAHDQGGATYPYRLDLRLNRK